MNIIVLAGGLSTERDVSFSTGEDVCKALRERGHQAAMLDVFLGYEGDVSEDFFVRNDAIRSDDKKASSPLTRIWSRFKQDAWRFRGWFLWTECSGTLPKGRYCIYGVAWRRW